VINPNDVVDVVTGHDTFRVVVTVLVVFVVVKPSGLVDELVSCC
jgi:hypothetical protein